MSVVIGVFVLSIVIFAIVNILTTNAAVEDDYARNLRIRLLEQNASNILRSMDTTSIAEKEVFFLQKDPTTSTFRLHTGTGNLSHSYVDTYGQPITNTGSYSGALYTRSFAIDQYDTGAKVSNQVIKGTIRELRKR